MASGDHAFAKIIRKYYLSTFFFNFILNVVIKYLLAELYVSIFLITPILQQGILELVLYGDLVINSKKNCWVTHLKRQSTVISKWGGYHATVCKPVGKIQSRFIAMNSFLIA